MSYNVLVVDDSSIIRSFVKKSLMMSGVDIGTIHEAPNGVSALECLEQNWIDIVFCDINMPLMTGTELVQKMSANPIMKSIPIVMVSSVHSEQKIAELKQQGIKAYIKKPFRPEQFRDVINKVLYD